MRTRFLSKCTNDEVEAYLARRDVIVVAAGVTELHGGLPLDSESVLSEALALRLAERADGLILHNLPYLYAGATASGRGTTQLSVRQSIDHCYALAESLIRQGFRRIIWTSFHGPARVFIGPVVRDIFEAHKVAMLYIDPAYWSEMKPQSMSFARDLVGQASGPAPWPTTSQSSPTTCPPSACGPPQT